MTIGKKILLAIGIVVVFVAVIISVVFYATSDLPKTADAFFWQIAQGHTTEAYKSTAAEFQAGTSEQEFVRFLKTTSLTEYESASWSSRSIQNDRGTLEGTVTTKSGGKIPLKVELVKEDGGWKIYSLRKPKGGLTEDAETAAEKPSPPSEDEAKRLAHETLVAFHQAVKAKDFTAFYQSLSPVWQKQTDATQLQGNFRSFIENDINLSGVISAPIQFVEAPSLGENNVLTLNGQVAEIPDKSSTLTFELNYHPDEGAWKLIGIGIKIK
jgi:FlaG/FlaF family flagellin (archaellin)